MKPIVIIHGWSDSSKSFTRLRNYVASLGKPAPVQINLADYVTLDDAVRFDDLVAGLQRAWLALGLPVNPRSVDVIAHSTGGLVIRDWLRTCFGPADAPVHHLLMLAPANFGSSLAHKGNAFYGRILKGFGSEKPFQTGTHLLRGLELASPYTFNLALSDRFNSDNAFGPGRILCTVLVGNTGYSGIMSAANEDGSDGTVRASTANLNCALLDIDFATDPAKPSFKLKTSSGSTAFRILDGDNHSTAAMKDNGPRDPAGLALIARALSVSDDEFPDWCAQCATDNLLIADDAIANNDTSRYGYQNTVTQVSDDAGHSVDDYFLEFYLDDIDDKKNRFAQLFHRDVIRTVHAHGRSPSYRSLMIDCTTLFAEIDKEQEYMKVSLTAEPALRKNNYAGYRTFTDDDIGGLRLTLAQIKKVFVPHRTLLARITLRRERKPEIFRLTPS